MNVITQLSHSSHPNARGQKRHPDEKGPFGKSLRGKTSRTRTATPAKKEKSTLDGFEQALKYDAKMAAETHQESNASARQHNDSRTARHGPTHTKEPTQIIVYGYSASRQYAAIDTYEKVSGGVICEDYDREPPAELRKYPQNFNTSRSIHSRPLTKQEKALAFKYDGGAHWIKLTCDSAEAAARAIGSSPISIQGYWVYAEPYNGKGPAIDQPIPITEEDRRQGPLNSPRPPVKVSQTLGAAFSQHAAVQRRATSTLPRSFNVSSSSPADRQVVRNTESASPSTASTATATDPNYPNLRNLRPTEAEKSPEIVPGIPRYVLRPASEALLPQPTWWERQVQWLSAQGLIPTDFIGHGLPILENGEFDWMRASWYWRLCYWFDSHLGTDICGLKEN